MSRKIDSTVNLPIFEGNAMPTKKWHVSYSEFVDWFECSYRHKLKHIDKVGEDKPTQHTEFGGIIHDAIEQYLIGAAPLDPVVTGQKIIETLKLIPEFKEDPQVWADSVKPIFEELPGFLQNNFQDYKVVSAEYELFESLEKKKNRYFKGFIDCILEATKIDRRLKEPQPEQVYHLLDWKTSSWGWTGDKKRDQTKQMQLVLYKHFWAAKNNIPIEKVRCAWVLLKRTAKPGQHIELVPVSVGEKAIEKALENIYRMIGSVEKKIFTKNRNSCKYCQYFMTENCL